MTEGARLTPAPRQRTLHPTHLSRDRWKSICPSPRCRSIGWSFWAWAGAVGFLSGLLGVGGGFLLTPLLIFAGIPSSIAVATTSSHITASSMSGALAQWRKGADRPQDGRGHDAGRRRRHGRRRVAVSRFCAARVRWTSRVSAAYVILLGTIGGLMLRESLEALRAARGGAAPARRGRALVAPRPAVQGALPGVAALYQRAPAAGDRLRCRRAVGGAGASAAASSSCRR